jgi:hypothetical protein
MNSVMQLFMNSGARQTCITLPYGLPAGVLITHELCHATIHELWHATLQAFITPGSTILKPNHPSPNTVAATNTDGNLVIVAVNTQAVQVPAQFSIDKKHSTACAAVHLTDAKHKTASMGSIPLDVAKTLLSATLPAESIVTFVFDPSATCGPAPPPPPPPPPTPPGVLSVIRLDNRTGLCLTGDVEAGTVTLAVCTTNSLGLGANHPKIRGDRQKPPSGNHALNVATTGARAKHQQVWSVVKAGAGLGAGEIGGGGACTNGAVRFFRQNFSL